MIGVREYTIVTENVHNLFQDVNRRFDVFSARCVSEI